jgi:methyl-accepting chemotaxis protein
MYAADVTAMAREQERAYLLQRLDTAVYATAMESRGLYMARDAREVERFGTGLLRHTAQIRRDAAALEAVADGDALIAPAIAALAEFVRFREELVRLARAEGREGADRMGNNDFNRANRAEVNRTLDAASGTFRGRAVAAAIEAEGTHIARLLLLVPLAALLAGGFAALAGAFGHRRAAGPRHRHHG